MPSCCRFSSLVGISVSDPDLRFISMVLSSAISVDILIVQNCNNIWLPLIWLHDLWRPCALVLIVLFPDVAHLQQGIQFSGLVTASLSAQKPLTPPTILASLYSDCSPRWSTAIWRLHLACDWTEKNSRRHVVMNLCFLSDVHTSCHICHDCAC